MKMNVFNVTVYCLFLYVLHWIQEIQTVNTEIRIMHNNNFL